MQKFLTISPPPVGSLVDQFICLLVLLSKDLTTFKKLSNLCDENTEEYRCVNGPALAIAADTGPAAKACAV